MGCEIFKKVAIITLIPNNDYCWNGKVECPSLKHDDEDLIAPYCRFDLGHLQTDKNGCIEKPEGCKNLKEALNDNIQT